MRALFLIAILLSPACFADAYVCQQGKQKIFSNVPCTDLGAEHKRQVATEATGPTAPTDFHRQLQNVQRNRAEIEAKYGTIGNVQYVAARQNNAGRCIAIPGEIRGYEAQIRPATSMGTRDQIRDRIQELRNEFSQLGC